MLRGPEDGSSEFLGNVSNFPTDYRATIPARKRASYFALSSTGFLTETRRNWVKAYEIPTKHSERKSLFGRYRRR
jgi:hypothetical protein